MIMTRVIRRAAILAAILPACVLPAGSAQAAPATDNVAVAITEQDESRVFDFAWDISRQRGGDLVDHLNSATARARCLNCGATAIAFQIVLVSGSPRTVVPRNTAEAVNVECTGCQTVAEARQFVRVLPDRVRFTGAGRAVLSDVRRTLAELQNQTLTADQVHAVVEAQEARVLDVLRDELVVAAHPGRSAEAEEQKLLQDTDVG